MKMAKDKKRGITALFFIQLFSTLSFSVLYSTLVLYTTKGLNLDADLAVAIAGSFIAFNYFLHLLGGYIGGRYLSYRFLFCLGMVAQTIGCLILAMTNLASLYWGLAIFLAGCGLNVTCINCMLTQLFDPSDKNRESAFLWNYSGMNIGFFIGFTVSGYLQLSQSYHLLFLSTAVSNLIAIALTIFNWKILKDVGTHLTHIAAKKQFRLGILGVGMIIILGLVLRYLLTHAIFSNDFIMIVGALMLATIGGIAFQQKVQEAGKKIWAFLILSLASLIYWTLYYMSPMGLTLFYIHNVDHTFSGFTVPPQWLLNINTIIIIIAGPSLAHFLKWMRSKGKTVRIPYQFALSLLLIGIGFVILPLGIHFASRTGMTSFSWIVLSYVCQSLGEILISPIG
ncbi:MAG: oligopeptide:H+ symporter, partial [Chlamydiia bacterium]|nr:oligopeptide:H+ symporter [Chlamydiia bacterium]